MQFYVCGFLFNEDKTKVVLIEKKRPKWQAGQFNGIGGHVEPSEGIFHAMEREFLEETGVKISNWKSFVSLSGEDWFVSFFYSIGDITKCQTLTDENIVILDVNNLHNVIFNLNWLIPLALEIDLNMYKLINVDL
jgi:8-oxo-dGTP diphosphatase